MTVAMLAILFPVSCTGKSNDSGSVGETCAEDVGFFDTIEVEPATMGSVLRVGWRTTEPVAVRALSDFGEGEQATPWSEVTTQGETIVLGIPFNMSVDLRLQANEDGGLICSPMQQATTAPAPASLPEMSLIAPDPDRVSEGFLPMAVFGDEVSFTTIIDGQGRFVWAAPMPAFRVRLSRDRKSLLSNLPGELWDGDGTITRHLLTGEPPTSVIVPGGHIDFVELPDGTLATLGYEVRTFEDGTRRLLGDTLLEVDAEGVSRVLWSVFDHFQPDLAIDWPTGMDDGLKPALEDWSHINGLSYDEASGDYLMTATFMSGVIRVDRGTGEQIWSLTSSEEYATIDIVSDVPEVVLPHSAELVGDNRVLVFSRGDPYKQQCSWVSELQIDEKAGSAVPVWHWSSDDCVRVGFLGMTERLPDGHTQTIWSSAGRATQTDENGELVWQLDLRLGSAFGFGDWEQSLY